MMTDYLKPGNSMADSDYETYLNKALAKYKNKAVTKTDILHLLRYINLKPDIQPHIFNDGSRKDLLTLEGAIPVQYKGSTYNIPICMYLMENYPVSPPLCYVRPTATMEIKTGKHVDSSGMIYLPYLHEWQHLKTDLIGLIEVMRVVFGEELPVVAKSPSSRQTAAQPYPTNVPPSSSSNFPPWRMTASSRQTAAQPYPSYPSPLYTPSHMTTMHTKSASSRETAAQQYNPFVPPSRSLYTPLPMTTMYTKSAASDNESAAHRPEPYPVGYPSQNTMYPGMATYMYPKQENTVFLSYQWDHQDRVLLLHDRLQERGYGCWMDIKQMGGGDSLYQMMDKGIREAKVVVSCVTPAYVESRNCQDEVALARNLKMPIIPVILEKTTWPPPGPMSIPFAQLLYINMANSQDEDPWKGPLFEELVRMIEYFVLDAKDGSSD